MLLGVDGAIDVFTQNPADLIVDVNGAYVPVTAAVGAATAPGLDIDGDTRPGGPAVDRGAEWHCGRSRALPDASVSRRKES